MYELIKSNKYFSLLILLIIIIFLNGCKTNSSKTKNLEPKEVIQNYFKYYNQKNRDGVLSTLTEHYQTSNTSFGFKYLQSIKLISIEDDEMNQKDGYMKYGRGSINGVKENNVVIYKVTYESVYVQDNPPWKNGRETKYFILTKKVDNAAWLIDDIGMP